MPGRQFSSNAYRYGMNGQEKDDEITGNHGTHTSAEYWEYDTRLGRRWNIDPITIVGMAPYSTFNNNPIVFIDPKGDYSKLGAKIRNFFNGGSGVYSVGEGKHKDWGYNTASYDENGKQDGIIANFGGTRKSASGLGGVLKNSLWHHSDYTDLKGDVLEKIKNSPEMVKFNKDMQKAATRMFNNLTEESDQVTVMKGFTFGGLTDHPLDITDPNTQSVATNELTWVVRHADVFANIEVHKNGAMTITYLVMDDLDLKPGSGHGFQYNAVTTVLGAIYHGALWGTSSKIRATWTVNKKLK